MFFEILCLNVMGYGVVIVFGGLFSPLNPKTVSKVVKYTNTKFREFNVKDLKQTRGEGTFSSRTVLHIATLHPCLARWNVEGWEKVINTTYHITKKEEEDLDPVLSAAVAFEQGIGIMMPSSIVQPLQAKLVAPIMRFLSSIPTIRKKEDEDGSV